MWWSNKELLSKLEILQDELTELKECFNRNFDSEYEFSSINNIQNNLNILIADKDRLREVEIASKTLDKFEDYMKNVDKFNAMINEFKGCVSLARASIAERKEDQKSFEQISRNVCNFMDTMEIRMHIKLKEILDAVKEKPKSCKCKAKKKSIKRLPKPKLNLASPS